MQTFVSMTIRLPNHLAEEVKNLAEKNHWSFNETIVELLLRDSELNPQSSVEDDSQSLGSQTADSYKPRPRSYHAKKSANEH